MILLSVMLLSGIAVYFSLQQEPLFEASADVGIGEAPVSAAVPSPPSSNPERAAATQAAIARSPEVAERAVKRASGCGQSPSGLLANSSVTEQKLADVLTFVVTASTEECAGELAAAYAGAYVARDRLRHIEAVIEGRRAIDRQLDELRASGQRQSAPYATLLQQAEQLRTEGALQGAGTSVIQTSGAAQVQPQPVRNGVLAGLLALVLGIALAFLRDALDNRPESGREVEERLGLPLLARIERPPAESSGGVAMVTAPGSPQAEAFRVLAANIETANLDVGATSILVASPGRGDGKSTTIANVAVGLARLGRRVVLVDMDLRRPTVDRLFDLEAAPGLTGVVLGGMAPAAALVEIPLREEVAAGPPLRGAVESQLGGGAGSGTLHVLPTGPLPSNAGQFTALPAVGRALEELSEQADLVLIDTPPALVTSDALTLGSKVDAALVVIRLPTMQNRVLDELRRVLEGAPLVKLGFILTDAPAELGYGYSYGRGYADGHRRAAQPRLAHDLRRYRAGLTVNGDREVESPQRERG